MQACHRKTMPCNMQHAPGSRGYATCKKSFMQSCKLVAWNHAVWVACDVITSLCYYVMESMWESMWESISPSCKKM